MVKEANQGMRAHTWARNAQAPCGNLGASPVWRQPSMSIADRSKPCESAPTKVQSFDAERSLHSSMALPSSTGLSSLGSMAKKSSCSFLAPLSPQAPTKKAYSMRNKGSKERSFFS
eukprot:12927144-Alexandrium_andersonii.AAC.1